MKVLQVGKYYPPHFGGMETALKDICETVSKEVDVEVVAANSVNERREETLAGIRVTRLRNFRTVFSQPVTPSLFNELRSRQADVVHIHLPNPLALACFLASRNPARLMLHYHSDIIRQKRLARLVQPLLHRAFERAEVIVVGSPQLLENSETLAPWRHKCAIVPFGIDLHPFLPLHRPTREKGTVQVLAVGRLSYYKGFQYLIQAAKEVSARFVIAGEGEMRADLESLIRTLGIESRVQLAGRVSEESLLRLYQESDIFCFPSCEPSEAFGLAMVEAMASGLPVVSTDLPTGVRLVNQDGVTGWIVRPGDPEGLARRLNELAGDTELRKRMGAEGRRRAQELFSRESMGQALLALYHGTLTGARAGTGEKP